MTIIEDLKEELQLCIEELIGQIGIVVTVSVLLGGANSEKGRLKNTTLHSFQTT